MNQKGLAPMLIVLILAALVGGYLVYKNQDKPTLPPQQTVQPTPTPSSNPESTDSAEIANWKIYYGETIYTVDGSSIFSIKYPPKWELEGNTLYPLGRNSDKGLETKIVLGAGGHGGPAEQEIKHFPAGNARYYWNSDGERINAYATFDIGNISYIFEVFNVPSKQSEEYEKIFNQMLSTFKFTK